MLLSLWVRPESLAYVSHLSIPKRPIPCLLVAEEVEEVQKLQVYWRAALEVLVDEYHQLPHLLHLVPLVVLSQVGLPKE